MSCNKTATYILTENLAFESAKASLVSMTGSELKIVFETTN